MGNDGTMDESGCELTPLVGEHIQDVRFLTRGSGTTQDERPSPEDYLMCVDEAWKMVEHYPYSEVEGDVLVIPDSVESRSVSEYSQDRHIMDDEYYTVYLTSRSSLRSSSGGEALRVALLRFCAQQGLERE